MTSSPGLPVFLACHPCAPSTTGMSSTSPTQRCPLELKAIDDPPHSVVSMIQHLGGLPRQVFTPAMVLVAYLSSLGPASLKVSSASSLSRDDSSLCASRLMGCGMSPSQHTLGDAFTGLAPDAPTMLVGGELLSSEKDDDRATKSLIEAIDIFVGGAKRMPIALPQVFPSG